MPPGITLAKPPSRVLERMTAEACQAIARRVQEACHCSGDVAGSEVANHIAQVIQEEILGSIRSESRVLLQVP